MSYKKAEQINKDKVYIHAVLKDVPRIFTFKGGKNIRVIFFMSCLWGIHKDLAKNNCELKEWEETL